MKKIVINKKITPILLATIVLISIIFISVFYIARSKYSNDTVESISAHIYPAGESIFAGLEGTIQNISVDKGDFVKKGTHLFDIKNPATKQERDDASEELSYYTLNHNNIQILVERYPTLWQNTKHKALATLKKVRDAEMNSSKMLQELSHQKAKVFIQMRSSNNFEEKQIFEKDIRTIQNRIVEQEKIHDNLITERNESEKIMENFNYYFVKNTLYNYLNNTHVETLSGFTSTQYFAEESGILIELYTYEKDHVQKSQILALLSAVPPNENVPVNVTITASGNASAEEPPVQSISNWWVIAEFASKDIAELTMDKEYFVRLENKNLLTAKAENIGIQDNPTRRLFLVTNPAPTLQVGESVVIFSK